jgi:putative endonuclease
MEHVVYILYSQKHQKTYTGETSSIIARFNSHNTFAKKGWTVRYRPWTVIHIEFFDNRREAIAREKWFKTGVGRRFKDKIIESFFE